MLLLITKGFRDLLLIGYQTRPRLFDLEIKRPDLLYERWPSWDERLDAEGGVVSCRSMRRLRRAPRCRRPMTRASGLSPLRVCTHI